MGKVERFIKSGKIYFEKLDHIINLCIRDKYKINHRIGIPPPNSDK